MGFDDAIYINEKQELLEATTSNAFFFKEGILTTVNSDVVKGITRNIILKIAKSLFPIAHRPIRLSEVAACEEAFLCSSVKDVVPFVQVDNKKIGAGVPGCKTKKLRMLFREYVNNYCS